MGDHGEGLIEEDLCINFIVFESFFLKVFFFFLSFFFLSFFYFFFKVFFFFFIFFFFFFYVFFFFFFFFLNLFGSSNLRELFCIARKNSKICTCNAMCIFYTNNTCALT